VAQDKVSTEHKDIDLDEIEVSILIIAKAPKTLTNTATFLSRRGWPTTAMSNLSQAIEFATDKMPDFILVSVNHPNPAISKFCDLLSNTFGTTCIAFAEGQDNVSINKLNKYHLNFKIVGQASGPNLQRSLRRILAEQLNISLDERGQPQDRSMTVTGAGPVMLKGTAASSGQTIIQKNDPGVTHNKASTLIKGEGERPAHQAQAGNTESVSSGKYTMTSTKRRRLKDIVQKNEAAGDHAPISQAHDLAAKLKNSLFGESGDSGAFEETESAPDPAQQTMRGPWMPAGPSSEAEIGTKEPLMPSIRLEAVGPHSLIERAVMTGLERLCRPGVGLPAPIEKVEQVGVFPVDSPSLPGYLVLAWPNDEMRAKEAFFKQAQQILHSVFVEMGIQARLEPGFFVTLPQVDFATWAQEKSAFCFSTAHGEEEIGVAFFGTNKPLPKPQQNEDQSMYSIGLDKLSTEQPVNFKVYLHMKKNKKYFLYLRNGRQLQPEQLERLKGGNVKDLFMKSIDLENLRRFLAACYLRKNIKGSDDEAA